MSDFTQRFMFDDTDVRGELTSLGQSYVHVLAKHSYPEQVAQLLGELLAAATLLVGTLKFDGLLVLQASSSGAVPLLMVECSSEREVRAIARYNADQLVEGATLRELMPDGALALTVDPRQGQRYQGIVALDGETLAVWADGRDAGTVTISGGTPGRLAGGMSWRSLCRVDVEPLPS